MKLRSEPVPQSLMTRPVAVGRPCGVLTATAWNASLVSPGGGRSSAMGAVPAHRIPRRSCGTPRGGCFLGDDLFVAGEGLVHHARYAVVEPNGGRAPLVVVEEASKSVSSGTSSSAWTWKASRALFRSTRQALWTISSQLPSALRMTAWLTSSPGMVDRPCWSPSPSASPDASKRHNASAIGRDTAGRSWGTSCRIPDVPKSTRRPRELDPLALPR